MKSCSPWFLLLWSCLLWDLCWLLLHSVSWCSNAPDHCSASLSPLQSGNLIWLHSLLLIAMWEFLKLSPILTSPLDKHLYPIGYSTSSHVRLMGIINLTCWNGNCWFIFPTHTLFPSVPQSLSCSNQKSWDFHEVLFPFFLYIWSINKSLRIISLVFPVFSSSRHCYLWPRFRHLFSNRSSCFHACFAIIHSLHSRQSDFLKT